LYWFLGLFSTDFRHYLNLKSEFVRVIFILATKAGSCGAAPVAVAAAANSLPDRPAAD
jgi:hypothetical protein